MPAVFQIGPNNAAPTGPNSIAITGIGTYACTQECVWLTGGGITLYNDDFETTNGRSPVVVDSNVIGLYMNHNTLVPNASANGMPALYLTNQSYNDNMSCCIYINDANANAHAIKIDDPGGNGAGHGLNSTYITNWWEENENNNDLGFVGFDNGPSAPGTCCGLTLSGFSLSNVQVADTALNTIFAELGVGNSAFSPNNVTLNTIAGPANLVKCVTANTWCGGNVPGLSGLDNSGRGNAGSNGGALIINSNFSIIAGEQFYHLPQTGQMGASPTSRIWAMLLPMPLGVTVNSTGTSGSLPAGTYGITIAGADALGNETDTQPPVYTTVNGTNNNNINLAWNENGAHAGAYTNFTLYYCTGASCTPNNKITGLAANTTGNPAITFNWTSTAGSVGGSPSNNDNAAQSWLYSDRGASCFYCVGANSDQWPIGIGAQPPTGQGINLATAKGMKVGATTFATLPSCASSLEGTIRAVTDSTTNTWGATITGSGSNHVLAYCDATNWTVAGK